MTNSDLAQPQTTTTTDIINTPAPRTSPNTPTSLVDVDDMMSRYTVFEYRQATATELRFQPTELHTRPSPRYIIMRETCSLTPGLDTSPAGMISRSLALTSSILIHNRHNVPMILCLKNCYDTG